MKRLLTLLLLFVAGALLAQALLPVPALTARVIDQTGTLDAVQIKGLEDKLAALEQAKGAQLVVLMVPT
ncbi:MAG: YgcG family protein, partial [Ramlibacter sp.]